MLPVGGAGGDAEGNQRDDLRAGIRQVVHGVRLHGQGAAQNADNEFSRRQQQIQCNADCACHGAVCPAPGGRGRVAPAQEQAAKKSCHGIL